MVTFRQMRVRFKGEGFHGHHLIPRQVAEQRYFAPMFGGLKAAGLDLDNFMENGLHLPYPERLAEIFVLPVHRGGHPLYNAMVSEYVSRLVDLPITDALQAVRLLQLNLRSGLRSSGSAGKISIRDPMSVDLASDMDMLGLFADRRARIVRIP